MKKLLFSLAFISLASFVNAQKQGNIWYFGDHAGLDFNNNPPTTLNSGQTYYVGCPGCHCEGTSVIADSSGALLFYCNGKQIWNRNQFVMPNGDGLLSGVSSTQSSLIIPQPGSSKYFYVFTTDDFYSDNLKYGFRYSIIDICLDGGLGDIKTGQKNIKLLDTVCEKLTAVKHANGVDYWVIVHKYNTDAFYAYLLSSNGIIDTVISHIGSIHTSGLSSIGAAIGQLKASPNGQKLACVNGNAVNNIAEYFDFNKNTGVVSNWVNIQWAAYNNFYGVSFSPDNSKLYIAGDLNDNGIWQFNLSAGGGNPDSVIASRINIASVNYNYFGLQLATNGKIYCAHTPNSGNPYLSVINYPNVAGISCNYINNYINLNGHASSYGLPNFIDSYDYSNTIANCNSLDVRVSIGVSENPVCEGDSIKFTTNITNEGTNPLSYQWFKNNYELGIRNNEYIVKNITEADKGSYYCVVANGESTATSNNIVLTVNAPPVITFITPLKIKCSRDSVMFIVSINNQSLAVSYQWSKDGTEITGATSSTLIKSVLVPNDAGTYSCIVSNGCGNNSAFTILTIDTPPLKEDTITNLIKAPGDSLAISIKPGGTPPFTYQWIKNDTSISGASYGIYKIDSLSIKDDGTYSCAVSNICGSITSQVLTLKIQVVSITNIQGSKYEFHCYPNPTSDIVSINYEGYKWKDKAIIEIYNVTGGLIKSSQIQGKLTQLNISDLSGGVYIIKVSNENSLTYRKMIKE